MYEKVCRYIEDKKLLQKGDKIVIGLSGGADSVCLFRILCSLKEKYGLALYAVHINHGIRGRDADEDEEFCGRLAENFKVPIKRVRYNVPELAVSWKVTEEEAGRLIRYREFEKERMLRSADKIAVAHHINDQAETILFRMCRGTGIKGMTGIPYMRDRIIRPLLVADKREILDYLAERGQDYREDITNADSEYDRNRIRNIIIPELEKINSSAVSHISMLAGQLSDIYDWYETCVTGEYEKNVCMGEEDRSISADYVAGLPHVIATEIIRRMIGELSCSMKDIELRHIEMVYKLCGGATGRRTDLPYRLTAENEYGMLRISRKEDTAIDNTSGNDDAKGKQDQQGISLMPDGKEQLIMLEGVYLPDEKIYCNKLIFSYRLTGKAVDINNVPKNICTKWFNYGRISRKLVLRRCMADDYICIGKGINKKMSRYMIDNKIPRRYRGSIMVLADGSRVLWIVGGRGSMDYYVDGSTEEVLQTVYTKV